MSIRTSLILALGAAGALACSTLGGCRAEVSRLCGDLDGDATCQDRYGDARPYCNTCRVDYHGCSDTPPTLLCSLGDLSPLSTTTAAESTSGSDLTTDDPSLSASSETGVDESGETAALGSDTGGSSLDCIEGQDSMCSPEAPICAAGLCVACSDAYACPEHTPTCQLSSGQCVECLEDVDCSPGQFCGDDFTCGGCSEHHHCPQSACDIATGECMDEDPILSVELCDSPPASTGSTGEGGIHGSSSSGTDASSTGDASAPGSSSDSGASSGEGDDGGATVFPTERTRAASTYCSIQEALDSGIPAGGRGTLRLEPSSVADPHEGFTLTEGKRVAILGGDHAVVRSRGVEGAYIRGPASVYFSRLRITGSDYAAIKCLSEARVWVDDAHITENEGTGIRGDDCRGLTVRRSEIMHNHGHGIEALEDSRLYLRASVVACNGDLQSDSRGLNIHNAQFDIRSSTVAGNRSSARSANLLCTSSLTHRGPIGGLIQDSVLVSSGLSSIDCPWADWATSVVDKAGIEGSEVTVMQEWSLNWFMAPCDMHLRPLDRHPFSGVAQWHPGDPRYDVDGNVMEPVPGERRYPGAHQPIVQ